MPTPAKLAPLIVLEGIDGSGKGTQAKRLLHSLEESGRHVALLSFPRYSETFFGARVGDFLNGQFGDLQQVDPFLASLLYAGDRFESIGQLSAARETYDVVVLDRYVPSNVAHQSAKRSGDDRTRLQEWIEHVEYNIFGLPRPSLVLLMETTVEVSQELIAKKEKRDYTDQAADLQEADTEYMQQVRAAYRELAHRHPQWRVISLASETGLRSIDDVAGEIQCSVEEFLSSNGDRL